MQDVRLLETSSWATEVQENKDPQVICCQRVRLNRHQGTNLLGKTSPTAEFSALHDHVPLGAWSRGRARERPSPRSLSTLSR